MFWNCVTSLSPLLSKKAKMSFMPVLPTQLNCPLSEEHLLAPPLTTETNPDPGPLFEDLQQQFPNIWAEINPPVLAAHRPPVMVSLLATAIPIEDCQYPLNQKARLEIARLEANVLTPCQSAWNMPSSPVRKPETSGYQPAQNLLETNHRWAEIIHLTVPNLYTLLGLLLPGHQVCPVLVLKDACFSSSLGPGS